jgi:hypothetical protein
MITKVLALNEPKSGITGTSTYSMSRDPRNDGFVIYDAAAATLLFMTPMGQISRRIKLGANASQEPGGSSRGKKSPYRKRAISIACVNASGEIALLDGLRRSLHILTAEGQIIRSHELDISENIEIQGMYLYRDRSVLFMYGGSKYLFRILSADGTYRNALDIDPILDNFLLGDGKLFGNADGDLICLRQNKTELIDVFDQEFNLKRRFMGIGKLYREGWMRQHIQSDDRHKISIILSYPNDRFITQALALQYNKQDIAIAIQMGKQVFLDCRSASFLSPHFFRVPSTIKSIFSMLNVAKDIWITGDYAGNIYRLDQRDLLQVSFEEYAAEMRAHAVRAGAEPSHNHLGREPYYDKVLQPRNGFSPPFITAASAESLKKFPKLFDVNEIPPLWLNIAISDRGEVVEVEIPPLADSHLNPLRLSPTASSELLGIVRSLRFRPMSVSGVNKACRCQLSFDVRSLPDSFLNAVPITES